jgi:hypothetical protein
MDPGFPRRVWKFVLFAAVQGLVCLVLSLLVGLLQILTDSASARANEFVGMYLVLGLWFAPLYWLIATPAHIYFYQRRQAPANYLLSSFASACVVLVGTALIAWLSTVNS